MHAYVLFSALRGEWLLLYFDSPQRGVYPVEVNAHKASALLAAFLTVHRADEVRVERVSIGYDGKPEGLSSQLEFQRTESFESLKEKYPSAWFIQSILQ